MPVKIVYKCGLTEEECLMDMGLPCGDYAPNPNGTCHESIMSLKMYFDEEDIDMKGILSMLYDIEGE